MNGPKARPPAPEAEAGTAGAAMIGFRLIRERYARRSTPSSTKKRETALKRRCCYVDEDADGRLHVSALTREFTRSDWARPPQDPALHSARPGRRKPAGGADVGSLIMMSPPQRRDAHAHGARASLAFLGGRRLGLLLGGRRSRLRLRRRLRLLLLGRRPRLFLGRWPRLLLWRRPLTAEPRTGPRRHSGASMQLPAFRAESHELAAGSRIQKP